MDGTMDTPMEETLVFVHLSDTHFEAHPGEAGGLVGIDPDVCLRRILDELDHLWVRPAFFIISGDIVSRPSAASYGHAREMIGLIESRGVPVLLGLGNHDDRTLFRRVVLGEETPPPVDWSPETPGVLPSGAMPGEPFFYCRWFGNLRVIMLDSSDTPAGIDDVQLRWLTAELATPAPGGTLVVLHHPVHVPVLPQMRRYQLRHEDRLLAILREAAPRGDILGVLGGHVHHGSVTAVDGLLTVIAPPVAKLIDRIRGPFRPWHVIEGIGFNLCSITERRLSVTSYHLRGEVVAEPVDVRATREANAAAAAGRLV
jgi:Icc protein